MKKRRRPQDRLPDSPFLREVRRDAEVQAVTAHDLGLAWEIANGVDAGEFPNADAVPPSQRTTAEVDRLTERLAMSSRQARRALHGLEAAGLVEFADEEREIVVNTNASLNKVKFAILDTFRPQGNASAVLTRLWALARVAGSPRLQRWVKIHPWKLVETPDSVLLEVAATLPLAPGTLDFDPESFAKEVERLTRKT